MAKQTAKHAASRLDIHKKVTDTIVAAIEAGQGDGEWTMPWHRPGTSFTIPKNALTGNFYSGINILNLWIDADEKKYEHQLWATYKQWSELNCQVRGGEKSSLIVKVGEWIPKDRREAAAKSDDKEPAAVSFARAAWVFNVQQVDGYDLAPKEPRPDLTFRLAHVDRFIDATKAEFRYGGQRAYYRKRSLDGTGDFIQIPDREMFTGTLTSTPTEAFEATRCHELVHWVGASNRLDRDFGKRFGDEAHSFEELVAEIGASYLCAELDITPAVRPDHAQYLAHWLKVLKADTKAIFTAASLASKAAGYLNDLQPKSDTSHGDASESDPHQ